MKRNLPSTSDLEWKSSVCKCDSEGGEVSSSKCKKTAEVDSFKLKNAQECSHIKSERDLISEANFCLSSDFQNRENAMPLSKAPVPDVSRLLEDLDTDDSNSKVLETQMESKIHQEDDRDADKRPLFTNSPIVLDAIKHELINGQDLAIIQLLVENVQESEVEIVNSTDMGLTLKIADGRKWRCRYPYAIVEGSTDICYNRDKISITVTKKDHSEVWEKLNVETSVRDPSRFYELTQVKDSFYDKVDTVHYVVYVQKISNVDVEFDSTGFTYYFSTSDAKFLSMYTTDANEKTIFYRTIKTKHPYKPEASSFESTSNKIQIRLRKLQLTRWTTVEASSQPAAQVTGVGSWNSRREEVLRRRGAATAGTAAIKLPPIPPENISTSDLPASDAAHVPPPPPSPRQGNSEEKIKRDELQTENKNKPTCVVAPMAPVHNSNRGFTGLDNLGNTCFMNSVIQVLVNTTDFRDFFLNKDFQKDLNTDNPLGCGGRLAIQFAVLVRTLWEGTQDSFAPTKLKQLVAMKASQFTGYAQHDAQEFLAFLLDGLHEDLNRIKDKPYIEHTSLDHLTDEEAAKVSWERYKMRNDSYIVDKFQGQYRSKLVCPVCSKISITFDPYMYVSVPLPKKKIQLTVCFFKKSPEFKPTKYMVCLRKDSSVKDLKIKLSKLTGVDFTQLMVVGVDDHKFQEIYNDKKVVAEQYKPLFVFEVEIAEDTAYIYCIQRSLLPHKLPTRCANCHKEPEFKLKRCSACFKVGYCNSDCQKAHWKVHKSSCKLAPTNVGQPFVVSLPRSKLTYKNMVEMMEGYAQYSVNTFKNPVVLLSPTQEKKASLCAEEDASNSPAGTPEKPSAATSSSSVTPFVPSLYLTPVDEYGCTLGEPLKDTGDELLEYHNNLVLALDWNNKDKSPGAVDVGNKELDCELHNSYDQSYDQDQDQITLERCLDLFTEPEILEEDEAWYCPQCKEHRSATKQMSLWSVPDILIIQMKRFSFRTSIRRDKIDKMVTYPIRGLDLTNFLSQDTHPSEPPIYDLYGVVNHHGSLLGGHYTAYARCLDAKDSNIVELDWRLMDDSYVSVASSERSVVNKAAYVLFYKRRAASLPAVTIPPEIGEAEESDNGSTYETAEESSSSLHNSFCEEDTNPQQTQQQADDNKTHNTYQDPAEEDNSMDTDNSYVAEPASPPDFNDFSGVDFHNESNEDDSNGEKSLPRLDYTDMDDID